LPTAFPRNTLISFRALWFLRGGFYGTWLEYKEVVRYSNWPIRPRCHSEGALRPRNLSR
jgi:hypothetical protein